MKNQTHLDCLNKGKFLLIGCGETYDAKIIPGTALIDEILIMTCGSVADAPAREREQWQNSIEEPDNWNSNDDLGPCYFSEDVGETDRIEIYLITDPA